jgi:hypothetical protein
MVDKGGLLFLVSFIFLIAFICFASARLVNAPTALICNANSSALYDEGSFTINWTHDVSTGDGVKNYTIFIWTNRSGIETTASVLYNSTATNDSALGFNFTNYTEANYTFLIKATNISVVNYTAGGGIINSTYNISMYVDRTPPVITLPQYTNGTLKKNTGQITLNISVTDALSGITGAVCLVDVNGTSNQTIEVDTGWCNSSVVNLTGSTDGNKTIKVYGNDTVSNLNLNDSFVVFVDTTNPTPISSCNAVTYHKDDSITCNCDGIDNGTGLNSSATTHSRYSTATVGGYSFGCTVTDYAGNTASSTNSYEVIPISSGQSSSGSGSTTTVWNKGTFEITEDQFSEGYTKSLIPQQRVRVYVNNEEHNIGIEAVTATTAKIEISSTPQEATLSIGDSRKFDVTNDGSYDILVTLNNITGGLADVTIKAISEKITTETAKQEQKKESTATGETPVGGEKTSDYTIIAVVVIIILIAVVLGGGVLYEKRKRR